MRNVRSTVGTKRQAVADKVAAVEGRKEGRKEAVTAAADAAAKLLADFDLCAAGRKCELRPCPMQHMKCCVTCRAAGRPPIKPRQCVVRECVAARKGPQLLALTLAPPVLALTGPEVEDAAEDAAAEAVADTDEVVPAQRVWSSSEIRCAWGCADAVMTPEEIELGYCSGRRCKAKMHPECFLAHTGDAGAAVGDLDCFCPACWATQ